MGREIISIAAGQAGNQIATSFWDTILKEHGLDQTGKVINQDQNLLDKLDVYFSEASDKKYVPRSIQVDLEPGVLDLIRSGPMSDLFRPDTFIHAESGAGNIWSKGYYTEGAELIDQVMDVIHSQAEAADCLQGFQLTHSLGGGTGSGLGSLLLAKIREEFPERMLATFSVFPSPKVSETVIEPYNMVLASNVLAEMADFTTCLDNEALYNICATETKIQSPTHDDLNALIAKVMAGFTGTLRFPGLLNSDLRKLAVNMVPFPRLHFFTAGYAPLVSTANRRFQSSNVQELTAALFNRKSLLAAVDPSLGKYLTVSIAYRGNLSMRDIEHAMYEFHNKNSQYFVPWIPNSALTTLCTVPPVGQTSAATLVANTTSISEVFKRTHAQFRALHRRKAFMHWYTGEGMEEAEFIEADTGLSYLCEEYDQYAAAGVDDGEEYELVEGASEDLGRPFDAE